MPAASLGGGWSACCRVKSLKEFLAKMRNRCTQTSSFRCGFSQFGQIYASHYLCIGVMNPLSPLPVIAAFILAIAAVYLLDKYYAVKLPAGRLSSIDGLRGYLGLSVYMHHSAIWFFYLKTGQWQVPPSHLYTHLGESSVTLFFMITGFLFSSKLLNSRKTSVDWLKLYVFRLLRLVPLYLVVIFIMFLTVALLSEGELREPANELIKNLACWLVFLQPDLNDVTATSIILAGVTWTLLYEWVFYLALPLLSLIFGLRPAVGYLLMGAAAILMASQSVAIIPSVMTTFMAGVVAAVLVRNEKIRRAACAKASSLLMLGCLVVLVFVYPSAHGAVQKLLLSIVFIIIAGGNTLFGLLTSRLFRILGEMTYSIYLLHGILLFIVFKFLFGFAEAEKLSPMAYWSVILACTPVLIGISFAAFRLIESPALRMAPSVMHWIRSRNLVAA